MRIFRPFLFGFAFGAPFGFPETGCFLLFGRGFLPWGGGAFFGLGGGGAFFPFGGGGGGGGGGGLSAMLTPHANTGSL